jgi:hypothetical protein
MNGEKNLFDENTEDNEEYSYEGELSKNFSDLLTVCRRSCVK